MRNRVATLQHFCIKRTDILFASLLLYVFLSSCECHKRCGASKQEYKISNAVEERASVLCGLMIASLVRRLLVLRSSCCSMCTGGCVQF